MVGDDEVVTTMTAEGFLCSQSSEGSILME